VRRIAVTPADGRDLALAIPRLAGHADAVILREPHLAGPVLVDLARRALDAGLECWVHASNPAALQIARQHGLPVHLRAHDPVPDVPFGRSCHDGPALDRAFAEGARLALLSPVFAPGSKPGDLRPTLGISGFLTLAAGRPVAALGGIDDARAQALERAGAWGVAGIRLYFR